MEANVNVVDVKTIQVNGVDYVRKSDVKPELVVPAGDKSNPFMEVGKSYFLRTVTHYFTGVLIWVGSQEIAFKNACWVADTGRFNEFMSKGTFSESEPYPPEKVVIIGRGSIIDMAERELITVVK